MMTVDELLRPPMTRRFSKAPAVSSPPGFLFWLQIVDDFGAIYSLLST